jgi:hypothetical protein
MHRAKREGEGRALQLFAMRYQPHCLAGQRVAHELGCSNTDHEVPQHPGDAKRNIS